MVSGGMIRKIREINCLFTLPHRLGVSGSSGYSAAGELFQMSSNE